MKKKTSKVPKIRRRWAINPKTRVKESREKYNRAKLKKGLKKIMENEYEKDT